MRRGRECLRTTYSEMERLDARVCQGEAEGSLRNSEQARKECLDKERWKLFCCGHPLVGTPKSRS